MLTGGNKTSFGVQLAEVRATIAEKAKFLRENILPHLAHPCSDALKTRAGMCKVWPARDVFSQEQQQDVVLKSLMKKKTRTFINSLNTRQAQSFETAKSPFGL